jgi:Putative auto-transporter adhesin, head GIN domain
MVRVLTHHHKKVPVLTHHNTFFKNNTTTVTIPPIARITITIKKLQHMKKVILGMALLLVFTATQAQENGRNYESDKIVSKDISVGNFTAVDLSGAMSVFLTQGDKASVKVEADEKVIDKVEIEAKDGTLYVKTKKGGLKNIKTMNVYITFTSLSSINNQLVGKLESENTIKQESLRYKSASVGNATLQFDVTDLKIDIAAVGNTEFSGKAVNCVLDNTSIGNVRAGSLLVENMQLISTAIGNLEYHAVNTKVVKSNGIGKVTNKQKRDETK